MFTGIVEELGTIAAVEGDGDGLQLQIEAPALAPLSHIGDSINVSGCCLTVVAVRGSALAFEVVPETLRRTALGGLGPARAVNLEDALRAASPTAATSCRGTWTAWGSSPSAARRASACGCASARPSTSSAT